MDKVFGKRNIKKKVTLRKPKPYETNTSSGMFLEVDFNGVEEVYELTSCNIHIDELFVEQRVGITDYVPTPTEFRLEVTCLSGDSLYSWLMSQGTERNYLPMKIITGTIDSYHTYVLYNSRPVDFTIHGFNEVVGTVDLQVTFRPGYYTLEIT